MQARVEKLAGIQTHLKVTDFVIGHEVRNTIKGALPGIPEQLFVCENDDEMELALFVEPSIITNLEKDDPLQTLHHGNLEPFCVALEGVSHFVFVTYRARLGRPVTPLELEIQGEVDKFVHALMLMTSQGASLHSTAKALDLLLFEHWELRPEVEESVSDRYRVASKAAAQFCKHLIMQHRQDDDFNRLRRRARAYYHRGLAEKLRAA
jgi:hypothetical protein